MSKLIEFKYDDCNVKFNDEAWINATVVAEKFTKRIDHYLENDDTKSYIAALKEGNDKEYILAKRGKNGGTWIHPELAVHFARWLDTRFAVWCDRKIASIIRGTSPQQDWAKLRHEAASSFKVMSSILKLKREEDGKETSSFHYANEAKLINWALTGEFKAVDRESLETHELNLLARLEERNAILMGVSASYDERKVILNRFAKQFTTPVVTQQTAAILPQSQQLQ